MIARHPTLHAIALLLTGAAVWLILLGAIGWMLLALSAPPRHAAAQGYDQAAVIVILRAAADDEGIDADRLVALGECESGLDPVARSWDGQHHGLLQFSAATWAYLAPRAGWRGASPYNPVASARVAAWSIARGGAWRWAACW